MTDSAFWMRVQALFDEALDWPLAERERRVRQRAGDDTALRDRVLELLAAQAATNPLDAPVTVREQAAAEPPPLPTGSRLGVWELQQRLGRGGMGEVYAARRVDGVVAQQAALKVLKRGLDTDAVLARFLRERDILARLSHPNIARLLDAGATADGRPWLAMERIDGQPLDVWVRERRLPLPEVLALMRTVCEAVQEAHRSLIVHRDLKPANVLVSADGQVKLLDFGIAKLLGEDAPDATRLSGAALPMTPAYAAPEQWRGDNVTTATDIYALGVMLYALLTGRLPREPTTVAGATQPVTRPSEALRQQAAAYPPTARPAAIWGRDLDLIVLKALHDEPARRYTSAQAFANDLARYLAREPVSAAPDAWSYRARLFVQRHRALSAGIVATTLSLLLGMAAVLWQAREVRAQRDEALAQAGRATATQEALMQLFRVAGEQENLESISAQTVFEAAGQRVEREYAGQPAQAAQLLLTLGRVRALLNDDVAAAPLLERALAQPQLDPLVEADARLSLGELRVRTGELDEAEALLREAEAPWRQKTTVYRSQLLELGRIKARLAGSRGDLDGERALLQAGIDQLLQEPAPDWSFLADYYSSLATAYYRATRLLDAYREQERSLEAYRKAGLEHSNNGLTGLQNQGLNALRLGRLAEAERRLREVLGLQRQLIGPSPSTQTSLGITLSLLDRHDEALALLRDALAVGLRTEGPDSLTAYSAEVQLGNALRLAGRLDESRTLLQQAAERIAKGHFASHPFSGNLQVSLAATELARGDVAAARSALDRGLPVLRAAGPRGQNFLARGLLLLSTLRLRADQAPAAVQAATEALHLREQTLPDESFERAEARAALALARIAAGERSAGRQQLQQAVADLERSLAPQHSLSRRWREQLLLSAP